MLLSILALATLTTLFIFFGRGNSIRREQDLFLNKCIEDASAVYGNSSRGLSERYNKSQITLGEFRQETDIIDGEYEKLKEECYLKYSKPYQEYLKINSELESRTKAELEKQ